MRRARCDRPPEISVLLPTYNRADQVVEALRMILSQEDVDFEVVVHDDGSTDDTYQRLAQFDDLRVRLLAPEGHLGIPGALNRLLAEASADYIVFLHDHDQFDPRLLAEQLRVLREQPTVGFVNPGVAWVDDDGVSNFEVMRAPFEGVVNGRIVLRDMLLRSPLACPVTACAMMRRDALRSAGSYFAPEYGFVSDVDLWLRMLAVSDYCQLTEPLLVCRRRSSTHVFTGVNWQILGWTAMAYLSATRLLDRKCDRLRAGLAITSRLLVAVVRGLAVNVRDREWGQVAVCARTLGRTASGARSVSRHSADRG